MLQLSVDDYCSERFFIVKESAVDYDIVFIADYDFVKFIICFSTAEAWITEQNVEFINRFGRIPEFSEGNERLFNLISRRFLV
ncbi:MAG TPA: hypothetical protein PKI71_07430 [Candidatus Rifleibacterium sp.]|nr:hypothetical protein [Candidatus Rifleibacterium sp.]